MKFEQAFYTYGQNQLSKYKAGLGVCAASNREDGFLDKCLALGGHFESERTRRTAEFTLYSEDFEAFVGVGISPREDGGDGRTNKLCHFFIPAEGELAKEPEQYLLDYPFRREIKDHEDVYPWEMKPTEYKYQDILGKYALQGRKLANLLWKAYLCAFRKTGNLIFVIDGAKHGIAEYGQIAREITWLVSKLLPIPDKNPDLYRKRISYGVYTHENVKAVRFIFTDEEELGDNRFYLDSEPGQDELIPQVYGAMAEWAKESPEHFQKKLKDMMQWKIQKKDVEIDDLPLIYFRWKLEKNEVYLSSSELGDRLQPLVLRAMNSDWHKQFLVKYLMQEKQMDNDRLVLIWRYFICPEMERYGGVSLEDKKEFEDAAARVIYMEFNQNKKNYDLFIKRLHEVPDIEKNVLHNIYDQKGMGEYIREEINGCGTITSFCECASRYSVLYDKAELKEILLERALLLYKSASKGDRKSISCILDRLDEETWKRRILGYIMDGHSEMNSYMDFLESEMNRIEQNYLEIYYIKLLFLFKDNRGEWGRVQKLESELQKIGVIENKYVNKMAELIAECAERDKTEKPHEGLKDNIDLRDINNKEDIDKGCISEELKTCTERPWNGTEAEKPEEKDKNIMEIKLEESVRLFAENAINRMINAQKDINNQMIQALKDINDQTIQELKDGTLNILAEGISESNRKVSELTEQVSCLKQVLEGTREDQSVQGNDQIKNTIFARALTDIENGMYSGEDTSYRAEN